MQIDFDPQRISYEQLLEVFWTSHNPCARAWSRQYMSAIFYEGEDQRQAIEATRRRFVANPDAVKTAIVPLAKFWLAEDYHQKYHLRRDAALAGELLTIYGDGRDFVDSTAAARLNGYLDGYGTAAQLEREIGRLGLSAAGRERLLRSVR